MMRIKKSFGVALAAVGLLVAGVVGYAQQGPGGPRSPMGPGPGLPRLQQLAKQLDLTDAQKTQIKSILENARTQIQAVRSNMNITKQQELDQLKQIADQTKASIRNILTPDQQAKADQLKQEAQDRMASRRAKMEEQMLNRLTQQLGLSDSQKSQIQLILANQKSQLQTLKANTSLTPAQKLEQMKTIRQQTQDQIKATLTADQQAKLDQLKNRPGRGFGGRRGGPRGGPGLGPMRGPGGPGPDGGPLSL